MGWPAGVAELEREGTELRARRVALLLSTDTFEAFFEEQLHLTRDEYVNAWRGGWVWSHCRMLRREGLEPIVYVASLAHAGRYETPDGFAVRFLPLRRWYRLWADHRILMRSPPGRYVAEIANGVALIGALRGALGEDQIDVLYIQEYWTGRYDYLSGRVDVPFIAAHQGLMDRRQVKLAKRRSLARAMAVTAQTRADVATAGRYGVTAIPIPNGVDTEFFRPGPGMRDPSRRTVLCVARLLDEHKRQGDLIRALAWLREPWRLRLVGTGPDRERFAELARAAGVAERVEFAEFVGDAAELRSELQSCSVFALVSRREGMPVALLEAMSCGAAVVGTDIPGIAEVVHDGENGLLVPLGQPERLARRIEEAHARAGELGRRARNAIERDYSERALAARLAEIVRRAPGRATPRRATDVGEYYAQYWSAGGWQPRGRLVQAIERLLSGHVRASDACLDVGCGDGAKGGIWLRQHAASYVGVDISPGAVARARALGLTAETIDDATALPFADASFDVVVCFEVLEHLFDPQGAALEMRRVLRSGGRLIVTVPNAAFWRHRVDLAVRGRFNPYGDRLSLEQPWRDPHIRFFTRDSLERMLSQSGFLGVHVGGHTETSLLVDVPPSRIANRLVSADPGPGSALLAGRFPSLLGRRLNAVATVGSS